MPLRRLSNFGAAVEPRDWWLADRSTNRRRRRLQETGCGMNAKVRAQCWSAADMITTPLFGICWLPSSSVLSIESGSKFFGHIVWNRQCFLTFGPVQQTPYVGFWNSVAIIQPSHPFAMETRYSFVFSRRSAAAAVLSSVRVQMSIVPPSPFFFGDSPPPRNHSFVV